MVSLYLQVRPTEQSGRRLIEIEDIERSTERAPNPIARNLCARGARFVILGLNRSSCSISMPIEPCNRYSDRSTHLDSVNLLKLLQDVHHSLGDVVLVQSRAGSVEPDGLGSCRQSDGSGDDGSGKGGSEGREDGTEHFESRSESGMRESDVILIIYRGDDYLAERSSFWDRRLTT